jgi:K+ transporter
VSTSAGADSPDTRTVPSRRPPRFGLIVATLGVVYGDIGTSPLYALRAALTQTPGVAPVAGDILGVLSLVVWSLVLVVTVKYVTVMMRADTAARAASWR